MGRYLKVVPGRGINTSQAFDEVYLVNDDGTAWTPDDPADLAGLVAQHGPFRTAVSGVYPKDSPAMGKFVAGLNQSKTAAANIAFYGSSSVFGNNASTVDKRYVNRFMAALQAAYPNGTGTEKATIMGGTAPTAGVGLQGKNFGVGGTTAANYYFWSTFPAQLTELQPFAVFHMVGSNDWATNVPPATYRTNLLAAIADADSRITRPHVHVLLHAFRRSDTPAVNAPYDWEDYRDVMMALAAERPDDILAIDLGVLGDVNGAATTDPLGLIDTDLIHPTDAGHLLYRDGLVRAFGIPSAASAAAASAPVVVSGARLMSDAFFDAASPLQATAHTADLFAGGVAVVPQESAGPAFLIANQQMEIALSATSMLGYPTAVQDLEISALVKTNQTGSVIMLNSRRTALASGGGGQARVAIDTTTCQLEINGTGAAGRVGNLHPWKPGDRIGIRSKGDVHQLLINGAVVETRVYVTPVSAFYGVACSTVSGGQTGQFFLDNLLVTAV